MKIFVENSYYPKPVNFDHVYDYYNSIKDLLIPECRGRPLLVKIQGSFMKPAEGFIKFNNFNEFGNWHRKFIAEYHVLMGRNIQTGIVNINPGPEVSFTKLKTVVSRISRMFEEMEGIDSVDIVFSGNMGFHIYVHFQGKISCGYARVFLRDFYTNRGVTIENLVDRHPEGKEIFYDTKTTGLGKPHIAKWSLNEKTGLVALPLRRDQLIRFQKEHANFLRVLKFYKNKDMELV